MPAPASRRRKLPQSRRIPISITLEPDSHALLLALARATENGNRSALIERLIRNAIAPPSIPAT
jgi:Ribbon-helix-helix protein, copG family